MDNVQKLNNCIIIIVEKPAPILNCHVMKTDGGVEV
jgi:hypothetical protein